MAVARPLLKDVEAEALADWFRQQGQASYRAAQLTDWAYRRWATSFEEMTNLPLELRQALAETFVAFSLSCARHQRSADGTEKFLLTLTDGEAIETVLMYAGDRTTVCVSTQVGCPVRCAFCASGSKGLVRDLRPGEIIDQVIFACRHLGARVGNVVVMGLGEPLLNLGSLEPALAVVCDPLRLGIGARHVTVSTSGIAPGIRRLADARRQWNLALSLHAADDAVRSRLIPAARRYPLAEVLDACRYYREQTGRMVTLEYTLLAGINDRGSDLEALARIARDLHAKVNLITYNHTGTRFRAVARDTAAAFLAGLLQRGVQASQRQERGSDIAAACGQLRQGQGPSPEAPP